MHANLVAADAADAAATRRWNSIEYFPDIHAATAHLNDLKST
jgi:hypothetical protein